MDIFEYLLVCEVAIGNAPYVTKNWAFFRTFDEENFWK